MHVYVYIILAIFQHDLNTSFWGNNFNYHVYLWVQAGMFTSNNYKYPA